MEAASGGADPRKREGCWLTTTSLSALISGRCLSLPLNSVHKVSSCDYYVVWMYIERHGTQHSVARRIACALDDLFYRSPALCPLPSAICIPAAFWRTVHAVRNSFYSSGTCTDVNIASCPFLRTVPFSPPGHDPLLWCINEDEPRADYTLV